MINGVSKNGQCTVEVHRSGTKTRPCIQKRAWAARLTARAPGGDTAPPVRAGSCCSFLQPSSHDARKGSVPYRQASPPWRPGEEHCPPSTRGLKWARGLKSLLIRFKRWPVFEAAVPPPAAHSPSGSPTPLPVRRIGS